MRNTLQNIMARWDTLVQESHERSRLYAVDPGISASPEEVCLSPQALAKRIKKNKVILELAVEQLRLLWHIVGADEFCACIADEEGYILHVLGEGPIMEHFRRRNCLPGYRWQERDMGTCGVGMVLHIKAPVQLHGHQMYSTGAQHITNSAVPVFDPQGELVCIMSLSGYADKVHPHTLGMLMQSAETLLLRLKEQEYANHVALHNHYMSAILESDRRGIIALDKKGNIVQFNSKAKELVNLSDACHGMPVDALLVSRCSIRSFIAKGAGFVDRELTFKVGSEERVHIVSLDPIVQDGKVNGGLFVVMDQSRALRLAQSIAGVATPFTFSSILGSSAAIRETRKIAHSAARTNACILLNGETGTGKELFAQAIHNASRRAHEPFIVINCGAIPKELLESELFGYDEGAFTGAYRKGRIGKLEMAHGGTVFLDEIGDMPFDMQVKLLRVLASGEIQRLGSGHSTTVDFRVIAATNIDLAQAMQENRFREDLYYRISTVSITIPPLRDRNGDIIELAEVFLKRYADALNKKKYRFHSDALDVLLKYGWPGNVRQLESCIERAVIVADPPVIKAEHLGLEHMASAASSPEYAGPPVSLAEMEKLHIKKIMESSASLRSAAKTLGVSRPTLYRKLKQYGLDA